MTLIELTVSLAILALMVLAFGQVLTSSQKVVAGSQGVMDSSAAAAAITQQLRDDLACQTPEGFLAIIAPVDGDPVTATRPGLLLASIRPLVSRYPPAPPATEPVRANAALIWYGALSDTAPRRNDRPLLARQAWLLNGMLSAPPLPNSDIFPDPMTGGGMTLARLGRLRRDIVRTWVLPTLNNTGGVSTSPMLGAAGTDRLWEVMAEDLREMSVTWSALDPTGQPFIDPATGQIRWFGYIARLDNSVSPPVWQVTHAPYAAWSANNFGPGSGIESSGPGGCYIAFWDREILTDQWPIAVRIRFELGVRGAESGQMYEVICPVRRPLR